MKFSETSLSGVFVIDTEPVADERGSFARTYCADEFSRAGLSTTWLQCNTSRNNSAGTIRGLHYQDGEHAEIKLVRCSRGAMFDVAVDIRPASRTYGQWVAIELTADNGRMIYIPAGIAHGFQTLADDTAVFYQMSHFYHPQSARGIRWNDPDLGIAWPIAASILSDRDRRLPLLSELNHKVDAV